MYVAKRLESVLMSNIPASDTSAGAAGAGARFFFGTCRPSGEAGQVATAAMLKAVWAERSNVSVCYGFNEFALACSAL